MPVWLIVVGEDVTEVRYDGALVAIVVLFVVPSFPIQMCQIKAGIDSWSGEDVERKRSMRS
jgi:hypothetical protein